MASFSVSALPRPERPEYCRRSSRKRSRKSIGDGVDTLGYGLRGKRLLAVTKTQYAHLVRWASGNFRGWHERPLSFCVFTFGTCRSGRHLERASLHDCLGGPFHPAMEMTWVMRIPLLWKSAYRLKVLPTKMRLGSILATC